jgi:uncharacterized protein (DUF885 family)
MMRWVNGMRLLAIGLLVLGGTAFMVPTVWFKPYRVEHLYARVFARMALQSPMTLSQLQVVPAAVDFMSARLDDRSAEGVEQRLRQLERELRYLRRFDRAGLSDRVSYDVAEWVGTDLVDGLKFRSHGFPLNPVTGEQRVLPSFMLSTHRIRGVRDARNYVARLERFDEYFFQVLQDLNAQEESGITPPRFVVDSALLEMRDFIAKPPTEHVLYTHLRDELDALPDVAEIDRAAVLARADTALVQHVYPAYTRLIAYAQHLASISTTDVGLWKLPEGDRYYQYQLRRHTTTMMTPAEMHHLGLQEVARIQAEIRTILQAQGHATSDLARGAAALLRRGRFQFRDSRDGRAAVLAEYQAIVDGARGSVDSLFGTAPRVPLRIEPVPEHERASRPIAYYEAPAPDASTGGVFFVNLRNVSDHARPRMRTLVYHETLPGHSLQRGVAAQLRDVPFFRKAVTFPAFKEGWAAYAEQLAAETGLHADPYSRLGYLLDQLAAAVDVVVDTGIHDKRWSRQQAIDYVRKQAGKSHPDAVADVERSVVAPGEAPARTIGRLKILELRARARQQLGSNFTLRDFHDVVLRNGEIPLVVLERAVDEWIAAKK